MQHTNSIERTAPLLDAETKAAILSVCNDDDVVKLTADLIAIPSHRMAPRKETDCAIFIRDLLNAEGIEADLQAVEDGRCNVVARLAGTGEAPSLMFNGHTDVVPPGAMEDAFEPRIVDGRLYGRGACDMKGGLASQICAIIALKRSGVVLRGDVLLSGVIAEEDGTSLGSIYVTKHGPRPDMVVVSEPSGLKTIVAHKGFDYYAIDIEGVSAHSSRPENGVNAVFRAADVLKAIETRLLSDIRRRRHRLLGSPSLNASGIIGAARTEENLIRGYGDVKKHPGGTVADFCTIHFDRRRIPGETLEEVLRQFEDALKGIKAQVPDVRATVRFLPACDALPSHPPLDTSPDENLVRHCGTWNEMVTGMEPEICGVPFWSDAAVFSDRLGIPAIVYGPGYIDQAHSASEFVPVDHLCKASRVFALMAASLTQAVLPNRSA